MISIFSFDYSCSEFLYFTDGQPGTTSPKKRKPKGKKTNNDGVSDNADDTSDDESESNDDGNGQVSATGRKKRKAVQIKKKYMDTPEDDYDFQDPFINDASSDEFEISSGDDNDSDWNDSQELDEESQETRRMLKEAKRFTNGKGKKQNK